MASAGSFAISDDQCSDLLRQAHTDISRLRELGFDDGVAIRITRLRPELAQTISGNKAIEAYVPSFQPMLFQTGQKKNAVTVYRGLKVSPEDFDPVYREFTDFASTDELFVSTFDWYAIRYALNPQTEKRYTMVLELQLPHFMLQYTDEAGATITADMSRIKDLTPFIKRFGIVDKNEVSAPLKFGQGGDKIHWFPFEDVYKNGRFENPLNR